MLIAQQVKRFDRLKPMLFLKAADASQATRTINMRF